jgi:hypothetical protein
VLVTAVLPFLAGGVAAGVLAGCGASSPSAPGRPDAAAAAADCRDRWQHVADQITGRDQQVNPSDLADRWTAALGTAQYYATSATAADCGAPLAHEQDTIRQIQAWSAQLRRYDIPYLFGALAPVATDYLLAPAPKGAGKNGAGKKGPGKKGTAKKGAAAPPTKKQVQAALTTLQDTATLATTDMQAGWDEATTVDLDDPAAVQHTLADLAFLAGDSTPYQTCEAALAVLERAKSFRS